MNHRKQPSKLWILALALLPGLAAPLPGQTPGDTEGFAFRELSLEEAVSLALAGNPDLAVAEHGVDVAESRARGVSSRLWPQLAAEAGYLRSVDPVVTFGTKLRRSQFGQADFDLERLNDPDPIEDWTAGFGLRWEILDPRLWAARKASGHQTASARWSAEQARQATLLRTRVLYYQALHAGARLAAAEAAEGAARATYETFRRRREQGLITEADLLQAEAELASAQAARTDADRIRLDALQELGLHLGWSPDTLPSPTDSLAPPQDLQEEEEFHPENRADLRALAATVEAAGAARRRARLDFVPALGLTAGYVKHAGDPFESDDTDWTINLGLRWSLFSGFGRFAELQRTDAEARIARIRYREALRQAGHELDRARRAVETSRTQVKATRQARDAAESARELMRRRFEEGLATAADLLQAQARATEMRNRAVAALTGHHIAVARLEFVRSGSAARNE